MRTTPDGPAAIAYRLLRARLRRNGDPQVIAVTGRGPAADTQVAAANLALAFTEGHLRRVVLVDGSLRASPLRRLLDLPPSYAGSTAACDSTAARSQPVDGAWRLAACSERLDVALACDRSGACLERLPDLLAELREDYDYVVVGLPAALAGAFSVDALLRVSAGRAGALRISAAAPSEDLAPAPG